MVPFDRAFGDAGQWLSALKAGVTQLVECNLAKVDVAGSNPVSRSILSLEPLIVSERIP